MAAPHHAADDPPASVRPSAFRTADVLSIALAHFVHDVFSAFLSPLLPLLIAKHGFTYAMAGLLNVAQNVSALFNPLVGVLADRFPVRYFLIGAVFNLLRILALGLAIGYLYERLEGRVGE